MLVSLLRPHASDPDPRVVPAKLGAYDKARRARTQRIARQAHLLGAAGQWPNPLVALARDTALRLAPDQLLDRAFRRPQRWTAPD
ncbi:hypothetical protein [Tsukamurella sp. PLM1]|uniref:hypothetical protein n=1 Tax=Tsukamurella sp. PLM1 TaxID=2929795 RepID=UPI0020666BD9|nr:hypothetical protein [Tsukamurella sp. PLM1]BDH55348.1 hypothetical protein MTP03_02870 [Tsukamurella sp. PLM1]